MKLKNKNKQLNKKIFVAGKVYDMTAMNSAQIEASVQADLDSAFGANRVAFKLYTIGNMAAMFFNRGFDYSQYNADPQKEIMDPDAFVITCHGYNGFRMPVPFPTIPWFGFPCQIDQNDFLDAYLQSAKKLKASKIRNVGLDISPYSVVLRVQVK